MKLGKFGTRLAAEGGGGGGGVEGVEGGESFGGGLHLPGLSGCQLLHNVTAAHLLHDWLLLLLLIFDQVVNVFHEERIHVELGQGGATQLQLLLADLKQPQQARRVWFLGAPASTAPYAALTRAGHQTPGQRSTEEPFQAVGVLELRVEVKLWLGGQRNHARARAGLPEHSVAEGVLHVVALLVVHVQAVGASSKG